MSREHLSREVLGKRLTPFDRAIDMHISNLRRKPERKDGHPRVQNPAWSWLSDGFRFMIGSLTARIFAIFWLTLALVLMLVLMLPKLDSRQMTELLDSEQRQGVMIEQHVEAELANDPPNDLMWWRRLFRAIDKWAPRTTSFTGHQ